LAIPDQGLTKNGTPTKAILPGLKKLGRSAFRKPLDRVSRGIMFRGISFLSESNFYVLVSYLLFIHGHLLLSPEKIAETGYGVNSGPLIAGRIWRT